MTRRIDKPDTDADIALRKCIDAEHRPSFVMVAGAGSGKTTSLIKALHYIGQKHGTELRRRGQRVACITYTDEAVRQIYGDIGEEPLFSVSTIHSFLWTLVKPFQRDIAQWVKQRMAAKLEELCRQKAEYSARVRQTTKDRNELDIARIRRQLATIDDVKYFKYESGRDHSKGILGHDDIIRMVPQLLAERPLFAKIVAQKHPFLFIDESQDTFPAFVEALRKVAQHAAGGFCLGFFGDPMQKIYATGVGDISLDEDWRKITKSENFRCPTSVLSVINRIRAEADELQQIHGRHELVDGELRAMPGTVQVFVLPADDQRSKNLERVRSFLADRYSDSNWTSHGSESAVKILVIAHRMAAVSLGFAELFSAFNDKTSEHLKSGFREGTTWALKPFTDVLLPLLFAFENGRSFEVVSLLRLHCPRLEGDSLKRAGNVAALLADLKESVGKLCVLMGDTSEATLLEVLQFAHEARLISLDARLVDYLRQIPVDPAAPPTSAAVSSPETEEADAADDTAVVARALGCAAKQVRGYYKYLNEDSPYSTQQGIKGAEFERVLVVLDDEEGKHNQFSYDKFFGLKELSKQDNDNQGQRNETVLDRTRRLFYVCCSRATKDLVVVLYAADVSKAVEQVKASGFFRPTDIRTFEELVESTQR